MDQSLDSISLYGLKRIYEIKFEHIYKDKHLQLKVPFTIQTDRPNLVAGILSLCGDCDFADMAPLLAYARTLKSTNSQTVDVWLDDGQPVGPLEGESLARPITSLTLASLHFSKSK